jgi:tetratricopeptide (TPR) repeat protein
VWDLPREDRTCGDLQRLAELLSSHRIDTTGGSIPVDPEAIRTAWLGLRSRYPDSFTVNQQELLAWHWREAESAERVWEWAAALPHLDSLVRVKPTQGPLWVERGRVQAELRHWNQAVADFTRALTLGMDDPRVWSYLALAQAARGDKNGYQQTCGRMLRRFGRTTNPEVANTVAWTCVLLPSASAGYPRSGWTGRSVPLAETALDAGGYRWPQAAALYRAGQLDTALKQLTEASGVQGGMSRGSGRLFLAMCHARLGHMAEARRWLDRAVVWMEHGARQKPEEKDSAPLAWDQWVELRLLRSEAEGLLGQNGGGKRQSGPALVKQM